MKKTKTRTIVRCALIASLYTAVSLVLAPIAFGAVQARVSEAFTLLPVLVPDAVVGVTLGCFLTNLVGVFTGANVLCASGACPWPRLCRLCSSTPLSWAQSLRGRSARAPLRAFCFRPAVLRWGSSSPASRWACRWCASLKKRPRCGRGSGIERFFPLVPRQKLILSARMAEPTARGCFAFLPTKE